jgi:hypothetical protein
MKRVVPLSGILAVGLLIASFAVAGDTPDNDAPVNEVVSFYKAHDSDTMASGFLGALAALFFLFFATSVHKALRRAAADPGGAPVLGFGGAIVFATGAATASALTLSLGDGADYLDPIALQTLHALSYNFFFPIAIGAAAFLIGNGIATLKTAGAAGRFPAWLGWPAIVFGILVFSPIWFIGLAGLGLWTIATSILLFASAESSTPAA